MRSGRAGGISLVLAVLSIVLVVAALFVGTGSRRPAGQGAAAEQAELAQGQPMRRWVTRAVGALAVVASVAGGVLAGAAVRRRGGVKAILGLVANLGLTALYVWVIWVGSSG